MPLSPKKKTQLADKYQEKANPLISIFVRTDPKELKSKKNDMNKMS